MLTEALELGRRSVEALLGGIYHDRVAVGVRGAANLIRPEGQLAAMRHEASQDFTVSTGEAFSTVEMHICSAEPGGSNLSITYFTLCRLLNIPRKCGIAT
jgi:hypothetical protein